MTSEHKVTVSEHLTCPTCLTNRTETIRFRVTPKERERYVSAAGGERKLSEWIRTRCDGRSGKQTENGKSIGEDATVRTPPAAGTSAAAFLPEFISDSALAKHERAIQALCKHPKNKRQSLGYGMKCGECGAMIR